VTGVSQYLGARVAAELAADATIERVIGVDTVPPTEKPAERVEFVRADIRNPLIAKVIASADVDTAVHLSIAASASTSRSVMKEMNVIGTMQLLAGCQKSECVRRLVVKSTTAVYGAGPRDPAAFTEDADPPSPPRSGFAKDAAEIEGYVRGFRRRRPDVGVAVLRLAHIVGPTISTPLTRYLSLPVVPTVLGFDPLVQLLHEDDAISVLLRATDGDFAGAVNVAGDGVLALSQVIRRTGRVALPVPAQTAGVVGRIMRQVGRIDLSPDPTRFVNFGRVVDTTRLRADFGYEPRFSTAEALAEFIDA
jgi:UDP-glucose 4-epimerase